MSRFLGAFFALCSLPAFGAITVVNTVACGSASSTTLTCNITPANGNSVIFAFTLFPATLSVSSVQDNNANNLTQDSTVTLTTGTNVKMFFYRLQSAASVTSVVATFSSSGAAPTGVALEVSGLSSSPVDAVDTVGNVTTTQAWGTNSITTTVANDLVIGQIYNYSNTTAPAGGAGYTLSATNTASGDWDGCYYQTGTSAAPYSVSGTNGSSFIFDALIISYKAAGATAKGGSQPFIGEQ